MTLGEELGLAFTTKQEYMLACARGNLGEVQRCLEQGVPARSTSWRGRTGLMEAAAASWDRGLGVVRLLLARPGCSFNRRDRAGRTALQLAARAGNLGVVRLLAGCGRVELMTMNMEEVGENWEAILEVLQVSMKERQKAKMQKKDYESSSDDRKTDVEISGQNKLLRPFNFSKAFGLKPTSRPRKRGPL
jgi:hypothetical protein